MAKKKNTGINLLKGIQGSKLAALATVLVILFAIPLTVVMTRQQQNLQQEASIGIGGSISIGISGCGLRSPAGGKCVSGTTTLSAISVCQRSGGVAVANCTSTSVCCVPGGPDSCRLNSYGHCQYTNVYCKSGVWVSNKCPGPYNYKCCKR